MRPYYYEMMKNIRFTVLGFDLVGVLMVILIYLNSITATSQSVRIDHVVENDSIDFQLENTFYGPVRVIFTSTDLTPDNLNLPLELIIRAQDAVDHIICISADLESDTSNV